MTDHTTFLASLLDVDGSCRDVTFEAPTWTGVQQLLSELQESFETVTATGSDGRTVLGPLSTDVVAMAQRRGSVRIVLNNGRGPVRHLQAFVSSDDGESPFVELTFFPDDLKRAESLGRDFIAWVSSMQVLLQARRYYVRYENASWQFGDIGPQSGVFLVSRDFADDA